MPENDAARRLQYELITQKLHQLSIVHTEAIMELCHALRTDQNVSENTRADAEKTWLHIRSMVDIHKIITKINDEMQPHEEGSDE